MAHEDDALRCCRAALLLTAVDQLGNEIRTTYGVGFAARIGIETGELRVGDASRGSTFVFGAAVTTAARLEQVAGPGECLVGPACHRLVRDSVITDPRSALALKGVSTPVDAHLLVDVADVRTETMRVGTPFIGRTRELTLLRDAFERAAGDRTVQLATVLGVAGMGKSRLTTQFLASLDESVMVERSTTSSGGTSRLPTWPGPSWVPSTRPGATLAWRRLGGSRGPDASCSSPTTAPPRPCWNGLTTYATRRLRTAGLSRSSWHEPWFALSARSAMRPPCWRGLPGGR